MPMGQGDDGKGRMPDPCGLEAIVQCPLDTHPSASSSSCTPAPGGQAAASWGDSGKRTRCRDSARARHSLHRV